MTPPPPGCTLEWSPSAWYSTQESVAGWGKCLTCSFPVIRPIAPYFNSSTWKSGGCASMNFAAVTSGELILIVSILNCTS